MISSGSDSEAEENGHIDNEGEYHTDDTAAIADDSETLLEFDSLDDKVPFMRMARMAHNLQLIIKKAYTHY
jgi:hypothetical protein